MNKLFYIIVAVFITAITTSCDKESSNHENAIANQMKSSSSHLVFSDSAEFLRHLEWVESNLNDPSTILKHNQYNSFTSLYEIYDAGADLTDSLSIENYLNTYPNVYVQQTLSDGSIFYELPYSVALAYVLNQDGEVQIDTRVIKAQRHLGSYSYRTAYFTSKTRIVGRLYDNPGPGGCHEYEARTTSQKKVAKIWWQAKIQEVGNYNANGTYYEEHWGPYTIKPAGYDVYNKADLFRLIVRTTYPIDFDRSTCLVHFKGKRDGVYAWITNEEAFPDNL